MIIQMVLGFIPKEQLKQLYLNVTKLVVVLLFCQKLFWSYGEKIIKFQKLNQFLKTELEEKVQ